MWRLFLRYKQKVCIGPKTNGLNLHLNISNNRIIIGSALRQQGGNLLLTQKKM